MNAMTAFFKKELREAIATHKLTVLGLVFLLFGIMNPLMAKLLPDILGSVLPDGMTVTLPAPSAIDSWAQFYKNIPQMGLIVLVLLYGGMMASELSRGTLTHLLTKGLSLGGVILAKYAAAALVWTAAYALCLGVTWVYTLYFWPTDNLPNLPLAALGLWVFGLVLLAPLPLGGVLFKSNYGSLLFTGALVVLLTLLNIVPAIATISPLTLASTSMALIGGMLPASAFLWPMVTALGLIAVFLGIGVLVFDRRSL